MAKFEKGKSGNPKGRPQGSKGRFANFRAVVEPRLDELAEVLIAKALEGDMVAMRLILERTVPKARDADENDNALGPTRIELVGISAPAYRS